MTLMRMLRLQLVPALQSGITNQVFNVINANDCSPRILPNHLMRIPRPWASILSSWVCVTSKASQSRLLSFYGLAHRGQTASCFLLRENVSCSSTCQNDPKTPTIYHARGLPSVFSARLKCARGLPIECHGVCAVTDSYLSLGTCPWVRLRWRILDWGFHSLHSLVKFQLSSR